MSKRKFQLLAVIAVAAGEQQLKLPIKVSTKQAGKKLVMDIILCKCARHSHK
jgi:hypothetical protein